MPIRIAHFSDIHITEAPARIPWSALLSKRVVGWANLKFGRRHARLANAATVAGALIKDLQTSELDHLLFTGDVTGLSLRSEFETAEGVLRPLLNDPRATGIPGNHDVYVRSAVRDRLFDDYIGAWVRTDLQRHEFPEPLRASYPYPLLRLIGDEVALVCLNDSRPAAFYDSSGRVGQAQLDALAFVLDQPQLEGRALILALHYGLLRADGTPDTLFHRLRDADDVLEVAGRKGVHLIVHGHIHHRFVHPQSGTTPAIVDPGALAYKGRDCAYHIYTVDAESITLDTRRYDSSSNEFGPWPEAPGNGVLATITKGPDPR